MEKEKKVIIKDFALNNLEKQIDYFEENFSFQYALKLETEFLTVVQSLSHFYLKYPECQNLPTKNKIYRCFAWRSYLIIYRIKSDLIEVLSLFHARQNPNKQKSLRRIK